MIRQLNSNSEQILKARYYVDDKEDWPALCRRVTSTVIPPSCDKYDYSSEETLEYTETMFRLINELYFLPNSPTLFNAGTSNPMLSACFIIDVEDDLPSIYESVKESAMIHKMGGGVGFSLHKLRSRGSKIGTTHGVSSGAVSFLRVFSGASEEITAGGRRRGANMCMLNVEHADVLEFLSCKEKEGDISNFNISITASDEFMRSVRDNLDFDLLDPKDGSVVRTVSARDLMMKIAHGAWLNGEPGLCFIDRVNRDNPVPHLGRIMSSNPCGEFYNIAYNSCNLGSLNLTRYVEGGELNLDLLKEHVHHCVEYLDCIIDSNQYPLPKIDSVTKSTRPVGLGVLGFADMLIMLGVRYDSDEGIELARDLAEFISYHSLDASVRLAQKRGAYKEFRAENHTYEHQTATGKLNWRALVKRIKKYGLRNSHAMVIAPTGTIARIANEASFGIEPVFALSFESNIIDSKQHTQHYLYKRFKDGTLDVPEDVFVTSGDISWKRHVDMQAAWQDFTHNGISKTINMAEGTSEDEVLEAYLYAHQVGLKGITVYVAGSRENEVLVSADRASKKAGRKPKDINMDILRKLVTEGGMTASKLSDIFDCSISTIRRRVKELDLSSALLPDKISRPDELWGPKYRIPTPSGNVYIEIGVDEETGQPLETIVTISKSGSSENAMAEALGKMVSKALQHRMDVTEVIETVRDIVGGDSVGWWRGKSIKSIPDALAHALQTYLSTSSKAKSTSDGKKTSVVVQDGDACPHCGEFTVKVEGCQFCPSCSHGKCA